MTFKQASRVKMPKWSDYPGKTIDQVAETDKGLRDLDKLLAWHEEKGIKNMFSKALGDYLGDPTIKKELERIS